VVQVGRLSGAAAVGLGAVEPASGAVLPAGASDDRVDELRTIERTLGVGPEGEAARSGQVLSTDLGAERRWPVYARRARDQGWRSLRGARSGSGGGPVAVVLLLSPSPGGVAEGPAIAAAEVLAEGLALQMAHARAAREADELRRGLETRAVIGEAVGILMERLRLRPDAAFGLLRDASQRRNVKLREVATHLVETGELVAPASTRSDGLHCLVCGERLPVDVVRRGGSDQGLAYTCPHCEKSIEFAPISVLAERRQEIVARARRLSRPRPGTAAGGPGPSP
jgi:hypothetical protein